LIKPDYTPRQAAYDIAIVWLRAAHDGKTSDISNTSYCRTPSEVIAVKAAIAKLHNQLLDKSGLDGMHI